MRVGLRERERYIHNTHIYITHDRSYYNHNFHDNPFKRGAEGEVTREDTERKRWWWRWTERRRRRRRRGKF